jgi:hypothetical protein
MFSDRPTISPSAIAFIQNRKEFGITGTKHAIGKAMVKSKCFASNDEIVRLS